jgi:hypothetical protein
MPRPQTLLPAAIENLGKNGAARKLDDPQMPGLSVELLTSGKRRWLYRRRVPGTDVIVTVRGDIFPVASIADARGWAGGLNAQVEAGIDPRAAEREANAHVPMTVARAHWLYMVAVHEGRSSAAKRPNKPRTILDKQNVYAGDIAPTLADKLIHDVTEAELVTLVLEKGKRARIRANRLAAELMVFFGWAASLRGMEVGLSDNPARRLSDLRFPETPRSRKLSLPEIGWFLRAVALEPLHFRRAWLLWLLTAVRRTELTGGRSDEVDNGVWTIPEERSKNSIEHVVALGPWGNSLIQSGNEWIIPNEKEDGPRVWGWPKSRNRILTRMAEYAGRTINRFSPHDCRRTVRSNTKRFRIDYETAEAMLNHTKKGLERTYDTYELEDEKRAWFLTWEREIVRIVRQENLIEALAVPQTAVAGGHAP